jgi:hypothetical protein
MNNFKFEILEDVALNENDGGFIKVKVSENDVSRNVVLSFDFGESLASVDIVDSEEDLANVFSKEVIEKLWDNDLI